MDKRNNNKKSICILRSNSLEVINLWLKKLYNHNFFKDYKHKNIINVVWNLPNDKHIGSSFESKEYDKEEKN